MNWRTFAMILAASTPAVAAAQATQPAQAQAPTAQASSPGVLFHFTGYLDATLVEAQGDAGASSHFTLAPIFHLQFGDRVLLEAELEAEADDSGTIEGGVEYATVNVLLNDNVALIAGKFLSPVGYFFQNLHPSWANRMASSPVGFGHGGAAPLTDVGVQLRGGKTFANGQHLNFALYGANGPRLGLEEMEDLDLDAEGSLRNPDGKRVAGLRLGWMPLPKLELGASLARGDVVLDAGEMGMDPEPARSYDVDGVDFAWHPTKALEVRGEWIRQQVAGAPGSVVPDAARWRAWYVQGAYRFGGEKWEAVVRHGDSVSPHAESTVRQTALGVNYLFRPSVLLKLDWEANDSTDPGADADRLLLQVAYGF